jgi:hypothetical protein
MGTSSLVVLVTEDSESEKITAKHIYVHFDGDTLGYRLKKNYNRIEKVEELINLGDCSSVGSKIVSDVEWCDGRDVCVPYSTRGEDCEARSVVLNTFEEKHQHRLFLLGQATDYIHTFSFNYTERSWEWRTVKNPLFNLL